jgi:osmotically-inducible protein OsmY
MKKVTIIAIPLFCLSLISGCDLSPEGLEEHISVAPKSHETQDAVVTQKIYKAVNSQPELSGLAITITTTKGVVKLSGKVSSKKQLALIENIVSNIDGVHTIHNHLTLE